MTNKKDFSKKTATRLLSSRVSDKDESLIAAIENIGFLRNEAIVYIYLLKVGREMGASKIALSTGINRQYVYLTLEKLISVGLVLRTQNGLRHKYKAMPPSAVERFARKKFDSASQIVEQLTEISTLGHEQDFEIYSGDKQVRDFEHDFISDLKENDVQYLISGASQNFLQYFDGEYEDFARQGKDKKLRTFYLGGPHESESLEYVRKLNPLFEYRLVPGMPNGVTSTVIRNNKVVIYSMANPPLIYVIHSQRVFNEYKAYFDVWWNLAK